EVDGKRGRSWCSLIGNRPLCVTESRASPRQNVAIEPRLFRDPLQGLYPVLPLPEQGMEGASRTESAARSLDHGCIATLRPHLANHAGKKGVLEVSGERNA